MTDINFSEKLRKIIKYYFGREIPLEFGKYANQISMDLAISAITELVKELCQRRKQNIKCLFQKNQKKKLIGSS